MSASHFGLAKAIKAISVGIVVVALVAILIVGFGVFVASTLNSTSITSSSSSSVATSSASSSTASTNSSLLLQCPQTPCAVWTKPNGSNPEALAISQDDSLIAAGSGQTLQVFDTSGNIIWSYNTNHTISSISISPNDEYIAAGGWQIEGGCTPNLNITGPHSLSSSNLLQRRSLSVQRQQWKDVVEPEYWNHQSCLEGRAFRKCHKYCSRDRGSPSVSQHFREHCLAVQYSRQLFRNGHVR